MNHRHLFIRFRHKFYFLVRYLTELGFRKRRTLGKGGVWTIHFCFHNADLALLSHRNERFCLELRDLRFAESIRHSHFFLIQSWFEFNRFYNYNFRCKFGLIWHPLLEICPQPGCSGSVSSIFKKNMIMHVRTLIIFIKNMIMPLSVHIIKETESQIWENTL